MSNKAKDQEVVTTEKAPAVKDSRDRGFWLTEGLKLIAILLVVNLVFTSYYQPKLEEQIDAMVTDSAQQIVVVNFAKILRETSTQDETLLQKKVAEAIKRLNAEGFIVLDATSVLGQHDAYVLETRFIDSIQI
ncbi:hypothetical protein [Alteromonas gracilis]|uniref:hypothetical protein n=1 Tax=Alteromonas gracilis TaxID=1479524 RepID=UPI003734D78D